MNVKKLILRILVYSFLLIVIICACFLVYFGDINKLKHAVEVNLKNQLNCTVKLGELNWDWDGFKLGVTTTEITMYDKNNNLVLQGGPSRAVWHIKDLIRGTYSHFYGIESTNLYLNAIRYEDGIWNLVAIFPPGPPPKVDNLRLNNSIVYLVDELNPTSKTVLYKDLNLIWIKKLFSKVRNVDLTTRVGTLSSPSFLRVKGKYTERKDFNWRKSQFDLFIHAKKIDLANYHGYFANLLKDPEIKKIKGEFTGFVKIEKNKNNNVIKLRSKSKTSDFIVEIKNKDAVQTIDIPKTDLLVKLLIDQKKITIKTFKSNINQLSYRVGGYITNWSKNLPEGEITLKTNKFNFKSVKPFLPLSLLPANTRERIEPINDDGFVEIDVKLSGPLIAPKYYGTVLLSDFNLTAESGFLNAINGLSGKLTLDDTVLKIDNVTIPIKGSPLILKGEVDNAKYKSTFNISGNNLDIDSLQSLVSQAGFSPEGLTVGDTEGFLDLNLDVVAESKKSPEIKGKINFRDAGISIEQEEPLIIKKIVGDLSLDGAKVVFNKLNGLINNETFYINGDFSLKEDEKVNLAIYAAHLKIIKFILSFVSKQTSFKPIADTVSGEFSDLTLNIGGTFSKPVLDGKVLIKDVAFSLPNLEEKISNIAGALKFEGSDLVIEDLNGKVQNTDFGIEGYIQDLFTQAKPNIRLVTGDIEIGKFWNYIKEQLQTSSLSAQAKELEQLEGLASVDIFLQKDILLGNVFFKDGKIKYKSLPFGLNNLAGRLVIGEKNLSLFGLMGAINSSNNFNCDLIVYNYLNPDFNIQGKVFLDVNPPELIKAINPNFPNKITTDGIIPTQVEFDVAFPLVNIVFYSTLDQMLNLEFLPYIKKPADKGYLLTGNFDFDTKDLNLYLNQFNIKSEKLSLSANGSIKNVSSQNPDIMLFFNTDEPTATFMIIEPIIPLMGLKLWGTIDLSGSFNGTPSMYAISSNSMISNIRMPEVFGKKLTAGSGTVSAYLDNEQGFLNAKLDNIKYASLNAKSVSLSGRYLNPVIYLNDFSLDGNPGSIYAVGSYDPRGGEINLIANGENIELSSLGSFIFLDPEKISGKTDFAVMIEGKGKTKNELISNTNGILSFSVTDGKLGQVALLQKGLQFANLFSQGIFSFNLRNVLSLFFKYGDGRFNAMKGNFTLEKGIVKANEFAYRAKDLFLNSFGFVDLKNSFVGLSFYGYLPERNDIPAEAQDKKDTGENSENKIKTTVTNTVHGAITIIPDTIGKKRFFIPFLSSSPPQYFKFEVKGNIKEPKKITSKARRSFKWLKGRRLQKEIKYVPKVEKPTKL